MEILLWKFFKNIFIVYISLFCFKTLLNMKCSLFVQISPTHSGSTVLINALIGSLFAGERVHFSWSPFSVPCSINVVKTHDNWKMETIQSWKKMNNNRKITFVSSSRKSINQTVISNAPNHIVFDYEDIIKKKFLKCS